VSVFVIWAVLSVGILVVVRCIFVLLAGFLLVVVFGFDDFECWLFCCVGLPFLCVFCLICYLWFVFCCWFSCFVSLVWISARALFVYMCSSLSFLLQFWFGVFVDALCVLLVFCVFLF
jgi:hypothetical protein